ncbi:YdcF family protein [Roseicyclus marinus]|uniref:YdcF family protein n=1 Tax=Roseicyclus marinus TaxID=2161673 RepID=UPI00240FA0E3|nr:YdcF family protein [Roseicyclus marinus]MDG3042743.1 YdcF family protein [Roseicyclus marinus]
MARSRPSRLQGIGRILGRLGLLGLCLWSLTILAVVVTTFALSRPSPPPDAADVIICLGAGVARDDPRQPDAASTRRAEVCAQLWAAGVAPQVIFTGAGLAGHSTAQAMAAHATALGLPPAAARIEAEARSTVQNAAYSLPLLPNAARRVVLVSDAFHLPRSAVIFRLAGYPELDLFPVQQSAAQSLSTWRWMLRESVVIWVNAARGLAYVAGGWLGIDRDRRIGWFD